MHCMEIWGGNRSIEQSFEGAGLDIHVQSKPFRNEEAGGDIYYLTACASGRVSRFLLADVSGHGGSAASLATGLRDLLRKNINKVSQQSFVKVLNNKFNKLGSESDFATAVVATFYEPTRTLEVSVAGHPFPLYYRARKKRWVHLDPARSDDSVIENMPLGIVGRSQYPSRKIKTEVGDMFLLYTDALVEAFTNEAKNDFVGTEGILKLLNDGQFSIRQIIPQLRKRIGEMAEGNLTNDDTSIILGQLTETKVSIKDNLLAPIRLLGDVRDQTQLST